MTYKYLSNLYIYPVKSMGEIALTSLELGRFGPRWDRRWMLVDESGQFITQRQLVGMAKIRIIAKEQGFELEVEGEASVALEPEDFAASESLRVRVWGDLVVGNTGPKWLDLWLSRVLERPCRLVFMPETAERQVDPEFASKPTLVGFADGFPLLLITQASLNDISRKVGYTLENVRFRPNIVVSGGSPWEEDDWRRIRIGQLEFVVAKPCSRCAIPTIDPQTLSKQPAVFKTLKQWRSGGDGNVYFGQNLIPVQQGTVRCGDRVEVLE